MTGGNTGALQFDGTIDATSGDGLQFDDADGKTRVKFTYAVGGYRPDGLDGMAAAVDQVIGEALLRLKAHIETGDAEQANLE